MSVQAIAWSARQVCGGASGKLLLYAIANYADEDGVAWPSQARLCADTELSERAVRDWLARLRERGLLRVEERRDKRGQRANDRIILALAGPFDVAAGIEAASSVGPDGHDSRAPDQPDGGSAGAANGHNSGTADLPDRANERDGASGSGPTIAPAIEEQPRTEQSNNSDQQPAESAGSSNRQMTQANRQMAPSQPANGAGIYKEGTVIEPSLGTEREVRARANFDDLFEKWPAKSDPTARAIDLFDRLCDDDRRAAIDGVAGYLVQRRAERRATVPQIATYLRERLWEQVPEDSHRAAAGEAGKPEVRLLAAFSPEWWLFVWWLAVTDPRKAALWVSMAVQRKAPLTVNVGSDEDRRLAVIKPAFRLIEPPFDDEAVAWLREFGRTGADLGERDRKFVVVPTGAPGSLGALRARLAAMGGNGGANGHPRAQPREPEVPPAGGPANSTGGQT